MAQLATRDTQSCGKMLEINPSIIGDSLPQAANSRASISAAHPLPSFSLLVQDSLGRKAAEKFIEQQFFKSYGARHSEYMPCFITMQGRSAISAAAGCALAAEKDPLFLERYLSAPVQDLLSERMNANIERAQIAEVGNLAGSRFGTDQVGSSRLLYIVLASMLEAADIEWMVFTATAPLLRSLRRLGLEHVELAEASDKSLEADERESWGTYYEHGPKVVAASLKSVRQSIQDSPQFAAIKQYYADDIAVMTAQLNSSKSR